jgi:hypothetical protein
MVNQQREVSPAHTPGQAEGERDPKEQSQPTAPPPTPSQAEGDRDTVDADLKEKKLDR